MFDFDFSEALAMTVGGVGMAMLVLSALVLLTTGLGRIVLSRASHTLAESQQPAPSPVQEGREDSEAALAAVIAVSLAAAVAQRRQPHTAGKAIVFRDSPSPGRWALRGRQDIMSSRSVHLGRRK